jgi:hypothetical protein
MAVIQAFTWEGPEITPQFKSIGFVNRERSAEDLEIIFQGNDLLRRQFGFIEGPIQVSADGRFEYSISRAGRFLNSTLLGLYRRQNRIGHQVAFIRNRDNIMEFYDSEGQRSDYIPLDIIQAVTGGRVLIDVNTHMHQTDNQLCARYALFRATYGNKLDNIGYNNFLEGLRERYGLATIADAVWNSTQNTLAMLGRDDLVLRHRR